jgi:hypothetical protein
LNFSAGTRPCVETKNCTEKVNSIWWLVDERQSKAGKKLLIFSF